MSLIINVTFIIAFIDTAHIDAAFIDAAFIF